MLHVKKIIINQKHQTKYGDMIYVYMIERKMVLLTEFCEFSLCIYI